MDGAGNSDQEMEKTEGLKVERDTDGDEGHEWICDTEGVNLQWRSYHQILYIKI